jgi:hypothetical protein
VEEFVEGGVGVILFELFWIWWVDEEKPGGQAVSEIRPWMYRWPGMESPSTESASPSSVVKNPVEKRGKT